MPAKLCNGKPTDQPLVKDMYAYCEGVSYRATDTAANHPKANNPHSAANNPVAKADWDRGWDYSDGLAGQTLTREQASCCGVEGLSVPV